MIDLAASIVLKLVHAAVDLIEARDGFKLGFRPSEEWRG